MCVASSLTRTAPWLQLRLLVTFIDSYITMLPTMPKGRPRSCSTRAVPTLQAAGPFNQPSSCGCVARHTQDYSCQTSCHTGRSIDSPPKEVTPTTSVAAGSEVGQLDKHLLVTIRAEIQAALGVEAGSTGAVLYNLPLHLFLHQLSLFPCLR